jgi:hypothetical protein
VISANGFQNVTLCVLFAKYYDMMKSRRMRWPANVSGMGETTNEYSIRIWREVTISEN